MKERYMPQLLNENIRQQVKEIFVELDQPVEIIFFGNKKDACEYCDDTHQILEEVASITDNINLQTYDIHENSDLARRYNIDKTPAFIIAGTQDNEPLNYGIYYAGIPAGSEFTSLIRDIVMVSKRDSGLSDESRKSLAEIKEPIHLEVFVTPSCPYCPTAVTLAHALAMENPLIKAEMIESYEFQELSNKYGVSGVPHTIINGGIEEVVGAVPEHDLINKVKLAVAI
jgi:glutaredoxin-like protein